MKKQKSKKPVGYLSLRAAGVLLVLASIVGTVAVSSGLASILNRAFNLHISIDTVGWIVLFSLAVGTLGALGVAQFFLKPVNRLEAAMNTVAKGDFSVRLPTERLRLREINSLYENFNLMARELSATEILQSDFVSNVSHEFKTPLAAVEGWASLLQDPELGDAERLQVADAILTNTRRLSDLVTNVLLLSKVENTAIAQEKTSLRLDEQIRQALITLEPKWSEKGLEPDVELEPVDFTGSAGLLWHVWMNLLDNAVKFTPAGGAFRVSLTGGQTVVFTVEDSGPGVAEADLPHVFDRFYQGDASRAETGNGLGLALVKRVVTLLGGSITVGKGALGGAAFRVEIPV